jgi:hypothetical protein
MQNGRINAAAQMHMQINKEQPQHSHTGENNHTGEPAGSNRSNPIWWATVIWRMTTNYISAVESLQGGAAGSRSEHRHRRPERAGKQTTTP